MGSLFTLQEYAKIRHPCEGRNPGNMVTPYAFLVGEGLEVWIPASAGNDEEGRNDRKGVGRGQSKNPLVSFSQRTPYVRRENQKNEKGAAPRKDVTSVLLSLRDYSFRIVRSIGWHIGKLNHAPLYNHLLRTVITGIKDHFSKNSHHQQMSGKSE